MATNKVRELISSKMEENEWLDYKREWHRNKVELVKDILSFANTAHNKDCYLVFGVVDKTFEVVGTSGDSNRKNTQQVTDLLVHQPLSGDAPKIRVETFFIDDKEVDVLYLTKIKNSDIIVL